MNIIEFVYLVKSKAGQYYFDNWTPPLESVRKEGSAPQDRKDNN